MINVTDHGAPIRRKKMKIQITKTNEKAIIPTYAKAGDAGLDLVATSRDYTSMYVEYGTGLAIAIPEGHVGLLFPRSSISKYHLSMANSVGVVDAGYRGELKVRFKLTSQTAYETLYNVGDRVAQLMILPYPSIEFEEVSYLDETERGAGGFGSSGT